MSELAAYPEVTIYSDGACTPNPGKGGWAAILICEAKGLRREISGGNPDTTNNQMELQGAIEGLKALKKPCKVTMYTDSQYVCNAFRQHWLDNWKQNGWATAGGSPVKNKHLWEELYELTQKHIVEWQWVKGHNGHPENEKCDQLAVLASRKV